MKYMVQFWEWLKKKWNIESNTQMTIIFIVFGITGSATAALRKQIFEWAGLTNLEPYWLFLIVKFVAMLIFYQILLLTLGFLSGQFKFFWWFFKKMNRHFVPAWKREFAKSKPQTS
jgi:hypothetical protein